MYILEQSALDAEGILSSVGLGLQ